MKNSIILINKIILLEFVIELHNAPVIRTLCFQQEYLRLPKNLLLTLHDLTKKWPKMTSNDLKSKNYRKKTPTKI